jgi:hypothetical protein
MAVRASTSTGVRARSSRWWAILPVVSSSATEAAMLLPMPGICASAFSPPARCSSLHGRSNDSIDYAAFS